MSLVAEHLRHHRLKRPLILLLCACACFAVGYHVHASRAWIRDTIRPIKPFAENILFMPKKIRAILANPDVERIAIDIKHKHLMKLAHKSEVALARGLLVTEEDDFVPATVRHNDKSSRVKLRLKGDGTDHLRQDKWSFRIKVKGEDTILGMKVFSIQHPETRNHVHEWLFQQALKREGVVSLRYKFIRVTLNGKDLGVYALEEHFDKRLIEHNQRREGPIVKFNENFAWQEGGGWWFEETDAAALSHYYSSDIDAFQTGKVLAEPSSHSQFLKAKDLLESSRRSVLKASDVYDLEKFARFFALSDLMGSYHTKNWNNLRFYYNPITSRLEPIGFDAYSGHIIRRLAIFPVLHVTSVHSELMFSDPAFLEAYIRTLERVAERSYLDTLLSDLRDELRKNLNIIHGEFPGFVFLEDVFYRNQDFIKAMLNPARALRAHHHRSVENTVELELGNIQAMPIEVLGLSCKGSALIRPAQRVILPKSAAHDPKPIDYRVARFTFPDDFAWSEALVPDLMVHYRLLGTSRVREESVFPWPHLDDAFSSRDFIRRKPNVSAFDFLVTDESSKRIFITPGRWDLDENLIVPAGYRLVGREDTCLNLSNAATILSYSPLELVGSADRPFVIESQDSTGQGIVVMNADQDSILEHVMFRNLSNPSQSGWELTGAVTFYESPVRIARCQFVENRSEDALNIVRSDFTIRKTLFRQTPYDAFDADFCNGTITHSSFVTIGNDAIDVSGSVIDVENVSIDGAGDKGFSGGEMSHVTANRVNIQNAEIAVASKDLSRIVMQNINISNSKIGLAAYHKKSEFGPAFMRVDDLQMSEDVNTPYLVEVESSVIVDNKAIGANLENARDILYDTE